MSRLSSTLPSNFLTPSVIPPLLSFLLRVQLSRNQRFTASFYHAVETLVNMLMPHITQKYKDNLDAARNANHSLAVFIKVGNTPNTSHAVVI